MIAMMVGLRDLGSHRDRASVVAAVAAVVVGRDSVVVSVPQILLSEGLLYTLLFYT